MAAFFVGGYNFVEYPKIENYLIIIMNELQVFSSTTTG